MNTTWLTTIANGITDYFNDNAGSVDMKYENDITPTDSWTSWFELRIDGPIITPQPGNNYHLEYDISILIMNKDRTNIHKTTQLISQLQDIFAKAIAITGLGCLELRSDIDIQNHGVIDPTKQIEQAIVSATYDICLHGD